MNEPTKPKPKNKWLIIAATAITTTTVAGSAFFFGFYNKERTLFADTSSQSVDLHIKGNRNSHIYHLPQCPNYDDISARNIVWFKTTAEAESAGYRIAKNC